MYKGSRWAKLPAMSIAELGERGDVGGHGFL